jgi:hypothetical protein
MTIEARGRSPAPCDDSQRPLIAFIRKLHPVRSCWIAKYAMTTIHSLSDNLVTAAIISGWRVDAILMGGLLWAFMSGYAQLKTVLA